MIKRNASTKTAFVLAFTIIIVAILFISLNIINKPNKEQITDIIINNEITINSSRSDVETDYMSIVLEKDEIKDIQIVESGYDFMEMKYFCIVDTSMYSKGHSLEAKLMLFMRYDKGWQLVDEIGVLDTFTGKILIKR